MIEAWRQHRVTGGRGLVGRQWLDAAKIEFGGRFDNELVEDVKQLKFVAGVFALLIPYWVLYFQMQTSFQVSLSLFLSFSIKPKSIVDVTSHTNSRFHCCVVRNKVFTCDFCPHRCFGRSSLRLSSRYKIRIFFITIAVVYRSCVYKERERERVIRCISLSRINTCSFA